MYDTLMRYQLWATQATCNTCFPRFCVVEAFDITPPVSLHFFLQAHHGDISNTSLHLDSFTIHLLYFCRSI